MFKRNLSILAAPPNGAAAQFMKSIRFFFCICSLFLWGCSPSQIPSALEVWAKQNGKVKVLSTTGMIDDIVGQIGGERIDHIALITGEIDPHSYELVKGDDEKLTLAHIIFYNGLGLEHGASLRYQIEHHPNAIGVGNVLLEKEPDLILHDNREIDPHIWMDISLWSRIIGPIADVLSQADPGAEEFYHQNAEMLRKKMLEEHKSIYRDLQNIPQEKRYLVTSHDAFNYFTRAYLASPDETTQAQWQMRCDAPEGLAPDGQLSALDIQKIIDHLIEHHVQIVFPESNVSRDSLKKVVHACAQKGLVIKISNEELYGDAMGPRGSDADTYLKMIRHDANVLIEAWK
jgi:manganese/zinc/iron transport system substrate-binding protein